MNNYAKISTYIFVLMVGICPLRAEVSPHKLFTDHMVLQRDQPISVWGRAAPGEKVSVKLGAAEASAETDASGTWRLKLPSQPMNATPQEMTIKGTNTLVIKDILVGDVWVCSGQSNMEFGMGGSLNANEEAAAANYSMIRHFNVQKNVQNSPQESVEGSWDVCNPQSVKGFTAVGYFFGRDLHKALNIPIGLVHASWGGSYAESWTTAETLLGDPDLLPPRQRSQAQLLEYVRQLNAAVETLKPWQVEAEKASSGNQAIPSLKSKLTVQVQKPWQFETNSPPTPEVISLPANPIDLWAFASSRFNGMIAPLVNYPIRGVIWYQGESNAERAWQYRKLLPALIADWRKAWGQAELPFYIVQLANFGNASANPCDSNWAELREAQDMTARNIPHCGLAVTIDVGEATNIHPTNKQAVGARLALVARAKTYGEKIEYSGPQYESMNVNGNRVILKFQHVGGGLVAKDNALLKQFAIADASRKFIWADARIEGDTVVVSSDKVAAPAAVRYAWQNNPEGCNLYNKEGLPTAPFRTDDWPLTTVDKR